MRRALLPLACALAALGASSASDATCAIADTPVTSLSRSDAREAILCITNAERNVRGLPSVRSDMRLMIAAQRHTSDMVRRHYFDHTSPSGTDPGTRITAAGYLWTSYGENIAAGYDTPRSVMEGWMASEGHCHNILAPGVTELGVGVARAAASLPGGMVGTWTQDFGLPRGGSPKSNNSGPQNNCPFEHLKGIDRAGNVAAEQPVAGASRDVGKLTVKIERHSTTLIVKGRIAAADGTKVRLRITKHGRLAAWGTATLAGGRYAFRVPKGIGDRVVIRAAGKRVSRSLR